MFAMCGSAFAQSRDNLMRKLFIAERACMVIRLMKTNLWKMVFGA